MQSYFVQAGQNMSEIDDRIPGFVDLVENEVTKELDDVSIPSFRPPWLAGESTYRMSSRRNIYI